MLMSMESTEMTQDHAQVARYELEQRLADRIIELEDRYEKERQRSRALESALLMSLPQRTQFPHFAVNATSEEAATGARPGGDFSDAFLVDKERLALVLGDVYSRGMVAAMRVPEIKYTLRAMLGEHNDPGRALTRLNHLLCANGNWSRDPLVPFATVAVVVINTHTGTASCSLAGSEMPILMRTRGAMETIGMRALPLGVEPGEIYAIDDFHIGSGELLVMNTDGLADARRGNEVLGLDGISKLISQAWKARHMVKSAYIGQHLLNGARYFQGTRLRDDATILTAERAA